MPGDGQDILQVSPGALLVSSKQEILSLKLEIDITRAEAAAKRAVNHLILTSSQYPIQHPVAHRTAEVHDVGKLFTERLGIIAPGRPGNSHGIGT